jgi:uncharacterized protein
MTIDGAPADIEPLERLAGVAGINHVNKAVWLGRLDQRLVVLRCTACTRRLTLPRPACPACWSSHLVPEELSGRGTLFSLTYPGQPGQRAADASVAADGTVVIPTGAEVLAVIEVEEQPGLRVTGRLSHDGTARFGAAVELAGWITASDVPAPMFAETRDG